MFEVIIAFFIEFNIFGGTVLSNQLQMYVFMFFVYFKYNFILKVILFDYKHRKTITKHLLKTKEGSIFLVIKKR